MNFQIHLYLPHNRELLSITDEQQSLLLSDVLARHGHPLNTRCGLRSLCDGCQVELLSGTLLRKDGAESITVDKTPLVLRACELRLPVDGTAEVAVPARSLLAHQPQVVSSFRLNVPRAHDPLWQTFSVEQADLPSDMPPVRAICHTLQSRESWPQPVQPGSDCTELVVTEDASYRCVCQRGSDSWWVNPNTLNKPAFGAAVDIGTTTVAATIVDLTNGNAVGNAVALNAQTALGDNVLTRINACMLKPHMTARMQHVVIRKTLTPLLAEAVRDANIEAGQLVCMVVAGNTTMLHLLLGVDPSSMGKAPFTPTFLDHRVLPARQLGLPYGRSPQTDSSAVPESTTPQPTALASGDCPVHLLPGAAAYVGADITAGILATGMAYREETSLLVDLGTNGEIVLRHGTHLLGCATAAGPAFEGAGLTYGVRAGRGAVGHIWLDDRNGLPRIDVIGGDPPIGICGTAYIDFVARARHAGLLTTAGRLVDTDAAAIEQHERHGAAYCVARGRDDQSLLITEQDIASLLQAKAAIAAGIHCLLKRASLTSDQVDTVFLAGGFGFHMHVDSLLGCGLLPGFAAEQVSLVGNTSLAGAYLALLDSGALDEIKRLSERIEIIELNLDPEFEFTYIDHLTLP